MNSQHSKKKSAKISADLNALLPAPPNDLLRDWIRGVDLRKEKAARALRVPIRFDHPKKFRLQLFIQNPMPPARVYSTSAHENHPNL